MGYGSHSGGHQSVGLIGLCLVVIAAGGCGGEPEPHSQQASESTAGAPAGLSETGPFAAGDGVLYIRERGELHPIAALPGAGVAPDTLEECAAAIPKLGKRGFRRLVANPAADRAVWQSAGPGACVGVVEGKTLRVRVLGHWSAAIPDSLIWAPQGGYVAVRLLHPDGDRSLAVFDAGTGMSLSMPWEAECEEEGDCDVSEVKWLGGTLLNVEIRQGPAELSVPYEVNVGTVEAVTQSEEI